jgi:hypothetical protein
MKFSAFVTLILSQHTYSSIFRGYVTSDDIVTPITNGMKLFKLLKFFVLMSSMVDVDRWKLHKKPLGVLKNIKNYKEAKKLENHC